LDIIAFLTAVQFIIVYVDLEFNIQKLVLSLVNVNDKQINKIRNKIYEI
jgi:hypothetical protein